ncbi:MAG: phage portal protein [Cetobacterium sp.]
MEQIGAKIIKNEIQEISKPLVDYILKCYDENNVRYEKLFNYYLGNHDILKTSKDNDKANNKLINNFSSYIVDVMTGYFIGKPVNYLLEKKDKKAEEIFGTFEDIYYFNNEQDVNYETAKNMSIFGHSYNIIWIDEEARFRFKNISPQNIVAIYDPKNIDDKINIIARVNYISDEITGETKKMIEIYDKLYVYSVVVVDEDVMIADPVEHGFSEIPFIEFKNNDLRTGDFEGVTSLIDGYNKLLSESLNEVEDFVNSFLVISGMSGTKKSDLDEARKNRAILTDEGGSASFISKTINNEQVNFSEKTIKDNIHKFSKVVDLTDEKFSGNASGVALELKLWSLEQAVSSKERKFKTALYKRIYKLIDIMKKLGVGTDIIQDIKINFNRNQPQNLKDIAETISILTGKISDETLISLLPFVDNPSIEIQKRDDELQGKSDYEFKLTDEEKEL